ncbi:MAG: hypothetical protein H0X17_06060 [Deltaproteobacteria bacterium]|nr:hypothetical protein [Deltaproteobacteria bacterium]
MRIQLALSTCLLATTIVGCVGDDEELNLDEVEQALTCPTPAVVTNRSLAVTDPTILAKFSFQRVMTAVNTSAQGTGTPLTLYKEWMATWGQCGAAGVDPNGYGLVCPRVETQLGSINPFATTGPRFAPVALMNRFDLAPTSGADCGEYRIVYAHLDAADGDRAFMIFEGRLPNPNVAAGLAGCAGVADFWARLSTVSDVAVRATRLERFFFTGITAEGQTFSPVVTATNYGMAASGTGTGKGQIRTNFFVNFNEWHLREFKLKKPCALGTACKVSVGHVTAKLNPADELFRGTHANTAAFEASFLNQIPALSRSNPAVIGMATNNNHNEFESSAQGADVIYSSFTRASFRTQITGRITNPALTATNILDRATTQTCGGCHQHSNGADLGNGTRWPSSLGFVHVDEGRNLSEALRVSFLPRRATVLKDFLDRQCAGTPTLNDGMTLAGSEIGAPN